MFTATLLVTLALLPLPPSGVLAAGALHDDLPVRSESSDSALTDAPLSAERLALLDTAFEAASALPAVPHLRDRSRAQQRVAAVALELGQHRRVRDWALRIEGWQRGQVLADLALKLARDGDGPEVQEFLVLAEGVARQAASEGAQEWSVDRVRARLAATYLRLGHPERAREIGANLEVSEQAVIETEHAELGDEQTCEQHLVLLDELFVRGGFDQIRNGLDAGVRFHERFYASEELRTRLQEKLKATSVKLPPMVRIHMLGDLARNAMAHADNATAKRLLRDAVELLEGTRWSADAQVPLAARLAELRWAAGDRKAALEQVAAALSLYEKERERLASVDRAATLRPLAAACHAMGEVKLAAELFRRTLDEGAVNPNARPRTNDLVDTCLALAQRGPEPDDALRERITELAAGLAAPW